MPSRGGRKEERKKEKKRMVREVRVSHRGKGQGGRKKLFLSTQANADMDPKRKTGEKRGCLPVQSLSQGIFLKLALWRGEGGRRS